MPLPFGKIALDNVIYNSYFDKKICNIYPNEVTILGFILTIIIGYVFFYNTSLTLLILLVILRTLCDIYDGLIARKCNKTTKIGRNLDILSDTLLCVVILIITYFKVNNKFIYLKFSILILIFISVFLGYNNIVNENYELIGNNIFLKLGHDNTIISIPIGVLLFYLLSNKFS